MTTKSKPKTPAQRVAESEARKRETGLVKCWVWIYPEDKPALKRHVEILRAYRDRNEKKSAL